MIFLTKTQPFEKTDIMFYVFLVKLILLDTW